MKISEASLSTGQAQQFGSFNVFIGGNGVGKSTLITEIFHRATRMNREKYHWVTALAYDVEDAQYDFQLLRNSVKPRRVQGNTFWYSQASKGLDGNVDLSDELRFNTGELDNPELDEQLIKTSVKYRWPFISFSNCDTRLAMPDTAGMTAYSEPPQDAINVLYRNESFLASISDALFQQFGFRLSILDHSGTNLLLGVSKTECDDEGKTKEQRFQHIEEWKEDAFTKLTEAGHGVRSLTRLLTSMFEPTNQVILIDEPEMHIYPTQKRWVGKKLVELAMNQNKQVFIVTHDTLILQGILDANTHTDIFRVSRDAENKGEIHRCSLTRGTDQLIQKTQEQYLQALFYQRTIVVEGAADRAFYQEYLANIPESTEKDIGMVVAGGKNNTVQLAQMAGQINLNMSFIFDLDVILELELLEGVLNALNIEVTILDEYINFLNESLGEKIVKNRDSRIKTIRKLTNYNKIDGFSGDWYNTHASDFGKAIEKLADVGLFIIPYGELESWSPETESTARYAENAIQDIQKQPRKLSQLQEYLGKVVSWLSK